MLHKAFLFLLVGTLGCCAYGIDSSSHTARFDAAFPELAATLNMPDHQILVESIYYPFPPRDMDKLSTPLDYILRDREHSDVRLSKGVLELHDPKIEVHLGFDPLAVRLPVFSVKQRTANEILKLLCEKSGLNIFLFVEFHWMASERLDLEFTNVTVREVLVSVARLLKTDKISTGYIFPNDPSKYGISVTFSSFRP